MKKLVIEEIADDCFLLRVALYIGLIIVFAIALLIGSVVFYAVASEAQTILVPQPSGGMCQIVTIIENGQIRHITVCQ